MDNETEVSESQDKWICTNCEEEFELDDEKKEIDSKNICQDCADNETFTCNDCGKLDWNDNGSTIYNDEYVCEKCRENYSSCNGCDNLYPSDDMNYCDSCDYSYCGNCEHDCDYNDDETPFRSYHKTPDRGNIDIAKNIKDNRLIGIEIEAEGGEPYELSLELDKKIGIDGDGSLSGHNPLEVITPPASAHRLEYYIDNATKALHNNNYGVNSSCGLHIHIDGEDILKQPSKTIKLFNTYYVVEPIIFAMLPKSRQESDWCYPLSKNIDIQEFRKIVKATKTKDQYYLYKKWYKINDIQKIKDEKGHKNPNYGSRYYGFNLHALLSLGHLELRYHNGTTNANKIKNWILFNLHLVNWALKNYRKLTLDVINNITDIDKKINIFLRIFNVPKDLQEYVLARVSRFKTANSDNDNIEDIQAVEQVASL